MKSRSLLDGVGRIMSLSARRAWIEILETGEVSERIRSLSARRAWIEIPVPEWDDKQYNVALRKESVD